MKNQMTVWQPTLPAPALHERVVELFRHLFAALRGRRHSPRPAQGAFDTRLGNLEDRIEEIADFLVHERRQRAVQVFQQLENDIQRGNTRRANKLLGELARLANL